MNDPHLLTLAHDMLATLQNVYLHHSSAMPESDRRSRAELIRDAEKFLADHPIPCEGCCDCSVPGIREGNDNGYDVPDGWQGIECCSYCSKYDDDVEAAEIYARHHKLGEVRLLLDRATGFTVIVPALNL